MKVAVLFSGGKDSTMALYNALETGHEVKYLLSMKSVNDESYMFHVPNIHITDLLAEALNIKASELIKLIENDLPEDFTLIEQ